MRRHGGDAVQGSYARGGGRSGAEPDESGMLTISAMALLLEDAPGGANPSALAAPSAETHAVPVTQVPRGGTEHGA